MDDSSNPSGIVLVLNEGWDPHNNESIIGLEATLRVGSWSGKAWASISLQNIYAFCDALDGYVKSLAGEASFEAGAEDESTFVAMRFYTVERGQVGCHVRLAAPLDQHRRPRAGFRLAGEVQTEPEELRRFARWLRKRVGERSGEVSLGACGPLSCYRDGPV
jgi:hypothetical protein